MGILGRLTAKKSCVPGIISWQNHASESKFSRPGTPNLASSRSLHKHTVRGILLLKRHSGFSYNQCLVIEMPISCCSHNSEVLWFQLGPQIIYTKKDDDQDC